MTMMLVVVVTLLATSSPIPEALGTDKNRSLSILSINPMGALPQCIHSIQSRLQRILIRSLDFGRHGSGRLNPPSARREGIKTFFGSFVSIRFGHGH
ncbi:MAG: hypothetical protein J3Q66DRAFT_340645 [Benniella sp.]|nr:MAG: hypothetical protein J3Q66DRAFT_340645 [Benniella sp.]